MLNSDDEASDDEASDDEVLSEISDFSYDDELVEDTWTYEEEKEILNRKLESIQNANIKS